MRAAGAVNRHEAAKLRCKVQVIRSIPVRWKSLICNP
jgi:hypothetical protein